MLISVIIAARNAEKWIKGPILSIIQQSYKNFEIIVIDDDSTDATASIVLELQKTNNSIKYYHNDKKGHAGHCWNKGLKIAKGDLVTFVDADDLIINDDFFQDCINEFKSHSKCDMVVAMSVKWDNVNNDPFSHLSNRKIRGISGNITNYEKYKDEPKKYLLTFCDNTLSLWAKMYRKSFLDRIKLQFPELNEYRWSGVDTLSLPYLFYTARDIKLLPKYVYLYNFHPDSDSYNKTSPEYDIYIEYVENFWLKKLEYLHNNGQLNEYKKELVQMLCNIFPNSKFSNKKWLVNNILNKYDIDL